MSAQFLDEIDWQRPWLAPFRAIADTVRQNADWRAALNALATAKALCNHRGLPIQFVPQANLPPNMAYETFISKTGGVPTRDNLHDFFNAIVWLVFPTIKIQLNTLQAAEIEKAVSGEIEVRGHGVARGAVRDAVTIFDENAALLVVHNADHLNALRAHQWEEVFLTHRETFWHHYEVILFGHALMEKLITPYKAITAHTWPVIADDAFFEMPLQDKLGWLDLNSARQVEHGLMTSNFTPLPVLGIPGWWEGQDNMFYADTGVFRPKRQSK